MTTKKYVLYVIIPYIILILAAVLIGTSYRNTRAEGYEMGYEAGLAAAEEIYVDCDHDYIDDDSYNRGYADGVADVKYDVEEAYYYTFKNTEWSVYEAWNNIMIYHDGFDPYGHPLPTEEEYRQSIETLVYFCMYMDELNIAH